jgi:hypothetical protein
MNNFVIMVFLRVCILAICAGNLWAQAAVSQPSGRKPSYLMRLERVREGFDVCVLVRGDGQYHLERHLLEKSKIFEGNLGDDELHRVIRIVSDDQMFFLRQDQIAESMLGSKFDDVSLAVLRPLNRWQILGFPDPASRDPYRKSLDPLLTWLDKLEKRKGQELSEDSGRNNCEVPQDIDLTLRTRNPEDGSAKTAAHASPQADENDRSVAPNTKVQSADSMPTLKSRPAQTSQSAASTIPAAPKPQTEAIRIQPVRQKQPLLRIVESGMYPRYEAAVCSVISPAGAYHFVVQKHEPSSSKVQNATLDGRLDEAQLASLRKILDAQELSKAVLHESEDPSFVPTISRNGFFIWMYFLREGKAYNYERSQAIRSMAPSAADKARDQEFKLFDPLLEWLKKTMPPLKAIPTTNLSNGRCAQVP